jgi:hypothetical protein
MTPEELMKPRYKVIADYPGSTSPVGEIIELPSLKWIYNENEPCGEDYFNAWPRIFKKLEWWEGRTLDELKSLKFAKVTHYVNYWRVGDIVPVEGFALLDGMMPIGYNLEYKKFHPACYLVPATEAEYVNQQTQKP